MVPGAADAASRSVAGSSRSLGALAGTGTLTVAVICDLTQRSHSVRSLGKPHVKHIYMYVQSIFHYEFIYYLFIYFIINLFGGAEAVITMPGPQNYILDLFDLAAGTFGE